VFQVIAFGWRGWYAAFLVSVSAEVAIFVTHHYVVAGKFKLHENLMHVPQESSPYDA
jgi:hypothetical protein